MNKLVKKAKSIPGNHKLSRAEKHDRLGLALAYLRGEITWAQTAHAFGGKSGSTNVSIKVGNALVSAYKMGLIDIIEL